MKPGTTNWGMHFILALLLLIAQAGKAQIPNAGFEGWTSGEPDGWTTSNLPPTFVGVTQSSDFHLGASAVRGDVISFSGFPFPPTLISGTDGNGFPYTGRPGALHGFYKLTSVSGDQMVINTVLSAQGVGIAAGGFVTATSSAVYREFVANLIYGSGATPDTAYITIQISNSPLHLGSFFILDDFAFGAATDVKEIEYPQSVALGQNYPNPFNPSTNITFQIPFAGFVSLKVYNLLGQEVATLVNEELQPGSYKATFDGSSLMSGTYFYTLKTNRYSETKKLTLIK
jgi:hypothetical protein